MNARRSWLTFPRCDPSTLRLFDHSTRLLQAAGCALSSSVESLEYLSPGNSRFDIRYSKFSSAACQLPAVPLSPCPLVSVSPPLLVSASPCLLPAASCLLPASVNLLRLPFSRQTLHTDAGFVIKRPAPDPSIE